MEAQCNSSSAKGRQSIAVLSDCEPSDRIWVLCKEGNVPLGTTQGKCLKYCDPGWNKQVKHFMVSLLKKKPFFECWEKNWSIEIQKSMLTMATHPLSPSDFGEGVLNLIQNIICITNWASGTFLRHRMETLLSFQHLTEPSTNLPVSPCPWQLFSSARSWLKSSWWAIQLSCKYHPHEYKAEIFRTNTSFTKQILRLSEANELDYISKKIN